MYPDRALERRNLVLDLRQRDGKITTQQEREARLQPINLNVQSARNELASYFGEEIRKYLESTYGTEAVHERGLRVYTTLNTPMPRTANRAAREHMQAHTRRHGWRRNLENHLRDARAQPETY